MLFFKGKNEVKNSTKNIEDVQFTDKQRGAMLRSFISKKGKRIDDVFPGYLQREFKISDNAQLIQSLIKDGYLVEESEAIKITEKGLNLYKEFEWIFEIKKYNIDIQEYEENRFSQNMNDNIWGILQKRSVEYAKKMQFGFLRNNYYSMYSLLKSEGKDYESLIMLMSSQYIDLSGWGNNGQNKENVQIYDVAYKDLKRLSKYFSEDMLDKMSNIVPSSYLTVEQFYEILKLEFDCEKIDISNYI